MKKIFSMLLLMAFVFSFGAVIDAEAKAVSHEKKWTLTFKSAVNKKTVNSSTVYVVNKANPKKKLPVKYTYSKDMKKLTISPVKSYVPAETYTLKVTNGVKNQKGKSLNAAQTKVFKIDNVCKGYTSKQVTSKQVVHITTTETHFGSCAPYHDAAQKLKHNTKYTYSSSTKDYYYEYAGQTDAYYFIMVAGQKMFVDKQDAKLVTMPTNEKLAYYEKKGKNLVLSVYRGAKKKREQIILFEAPDFLKTGIKYTSPDGAKFYNKGKLVGTAYNYFQHVSLRVPTNYSAAEINAYLKKKLAKNSALHGIGDTLIAAEKKYNINALFLLAFAINESSWGTSNYAIKHKNLFGYEIYDINPNKKKYTSVKENLDVMLNYVNRKYLTAEQDYARGATIGTNAHGLNAKYSTDPYWGLKIAALMDQLDIALGKKDKHSQQVGIINSSYNYANIRPVASSSAQARVYTHSPSNGRGITILGEENGFFKIVNDYKKEPVFISKPLAKILKMY